MAEGVGGINCVVGGDLCCENKGWRRSHSLWGRKAD